MLAAEALLVRRVREKLRERHRHDPRSFARAANYLVATDLLQAIRLIRKNRT